MLEKISQRVNKIAEKVSITMLVIMTLVIWLQVVSRYIFNNTPPWTEEVARYAMIWLAMLGASITVWEDKNVSVDFLVNRFPPYFRKVLTVLLRVVSLMLFLIIIVFGWKYALVGQGAISPSTGIKYFWAYLAVPVGGLAMFFQSFTLLARELKELRTK